jgi:lipid II:glycine glycyltransferase (peptidoglycan interpeptide bridge formation enzyme)
VRVEEIYKEDLPEAYNLLRETYINAKLPLADISLFYSSFDKLNRMFKIFAAKHKGKHIGAIFLLAYRDRVYDWYAGSSRDHLHLYPNDLLCWHAIEWSKEMGYKIFDFGGAGKVNKEYGVRKFKRQFGGIKVFHNRLIKIHQPLKLNIAKVGFEIYRRVKL